MANGQNKKFWHRRRKNKTVTWRGLIKQNIIKKKREKTCLFFPCHASVRSVDHLADLMKIEKKTVSKILVLNEQNFQLSPEMFYKFQFIKSLIRLLLRRRYYVYLHTLVVNT